MGKKKETNPEIIEAEKNESYTDEIDDMPASGGAPDGMHYAELVKHMLDRKNINLITDLKDSEISIIACLEVIANEFDDDLLKAFLGTFKELKLSRNRASRKELVDIFRTINAQNAREEKGGFFERALGFRGKDGW